MKRSALLQVCASACLVAAMACGVESIAFRAGTVLQGEWNAAHLALSLHESGGTTEYDCAHGELSEPLVLDASGRFSSIGVHVREHGGPIREGEVVDVRPARYFGHYESSKLTLRVAVDADTLGPFVLRRGAPTQLVKCL